MALRVDDGLVRRSYNEQQQLVTSNKWLTIDNAVVSWCPGGSDPSCLLFSMPFPYKHRSVMQQAAQSYLCYTDFYYAYERKYVRVIITERWMLLDEYGWIRILRVTVTNERQCSFTWFDSMIEKACWLIIHLTIWRKCGK